MLRWTLFLGTQGSSPQTRLLPFPSPTVSHVRGLGAKPARRGWVRMESGVLDTWDLVNRSGTGFWASFLPLNGHMMLVQYFSLDRGANHTYL